METSSLLSITSHPRIYSYTPLKEKKNIRLLHLQPLNDDPYPQVLLVEISFDEARSLGYEALSYAWGPAIFSEHILVEGEHLPVTPNLLAALKALRGHHPRLLWIDAICINQEELVEKGSQIPLMTDIYRSAKQVLVWLGEETEAARMAFDWIPKFTEELRAILNQDNSSVLVKDERCRNIFERHNEGTAVTELFERDWFMRLWVVQEVVPAHSVLFICGSLRMPYDTLADFACFLGSGKIAHCCVTSRKARLGCQQLEGLHKIRSEKYGTNDTARSRHFYLINMIVQTTYRKCLDPRDRLYALAGLVSDPRCLPYRTDYEKDATAVYTDFARYNICQTKSLQILAYCYLHPDPMCGLATWVPDWTRPRLCIFTSTPGRQRLCVYSASGNASGKYQNPIFQPNSEPPAIILKCAMVDTIKVVWPLPFSSTSHDPREDLITDSTFRSDVGPTLEQLLIFCGASS
jgi:hypothetical protein